MVNINYVYLLLIPPIVIKQHTIMLSILSLLSFAVIAACSYVNIEFYLGIKSPAVCMSVEVTLYVLKKYSPDYCHIEDTVTFINDKGNVSLCGNHIINVSSHLIEPSKGFRLYWAPGPSLGYETLTISNVSVSYGPNKSEISCNGEFRHINSNMDAIPSLIPGVLSPKIMINSDCRVMISNESTCPSNQTLSIIVCPTFFLTSTLPDPASCPTISVTSTYFTLTSTASASPSPPLSFTNYSSSHLTHSLSVTSTFSIISMPPNPSSIISSSSYPIHAPSLTSYSSATTVSSFSLLSPTISPSPLLCPAQDSQWQETAAGQNATGTCHKGTFNGQFDHLCHTLYLSFH